MQSQQTFKNIDKTSADLSSLFLALNKSHKCQKYLFFFLIITLETKCFFCLNNVPQTSTSHGRKSVNLPFVNGPCFFLALQPKTE